MKNVLRTLVYNDQVSLAVIDTTEIVREGIRLHGLSKASAYVFGKCLSAMAYMSSCLKNERGEISLAVKGDGTGGDIAVSGNRALRIRGYIDNTQVEGGISFEEERACFGKNGALTIIRDDGYNRPFVGSCALTKYGGVDEAFEEYYAISEQIPACLMTKVEFDDNGECIFAGVAAMQALPFASAETLDKVGEFPFEELLAAVKEKGVEEAVRAYFDETESVWELREAAYKCNCSREYLTRVLVSLGEAQLREIIREEGAARVHCHYCNTDYAFTDEDADKIFSKK